MALLWDVFCRVIDNHGDAGVCWRLAADLAGRGERVRLWIDDDAALRWMAPHGAPGVSVRPWAAAAQEQAPGDVVIEAFGCELPPAFVRRMAAVTRAPVWINLEYLSAEGFAERAHRLPSPQPLGLRKTFFYPGFTARSGGLLREPDLAARQHAFDAQAWLAVRGVARRDASEQVVSLFCYEQPALADWLADWSRTPTLLLASFGHAAQQVQAALGAELCRGELRAVLLPALSQPEYDELLWASDLNLVRGEDSFVRAQWAGRPFVWQIYPQHDGVHLDKLDAFLGRFLHGAEPALAARLRSAFSAWNGAAPTSSSNRSAAPPIDEAWRRHCELWRDALRAQADLTTQLIDFVRETG